MHAERGEGMRKGSSLKGREVGRSAVVGMARLPIGDKGDEGVVSRSATCFWEFARGWRALLFGFLPRRRGCLLLRFLGLACIVAFFTSLRPWWLRPSMLVVRKDTQIKKLPQQNKEACAVLKLPNPHAMGNT
jgi:hypothetical protein